MASKFSASIKIDASTNINKAVFAMSKGFGKMAKDSRKLSEALRQNQELINRFGSSARRLGTIISGVAIGGMAAAISSGSKFQDSLQDLSALTGATGKQLDDMGKRALEMSKKYGVAAPQILETNKLIASAMPALLRQPVLMAKVTDEAIKLAKASRMNLGEATASLTTTLNQFNLTGKEAGRVINTLAAGAKEGAAPIPYLAEAIEKAGTTFALMGISVEDSVAIVETIAPKFAKATLAGNSLDKAFLKMRENGIGFKDGVFDINSALNEIQGYLDDGATVAGMFGVEHAKVVEVLLQGQSEFNRYSDAVKNTNEAQIQADKNMKTLNESIRRLGTSVQKSLIELFLKYEPVLTKVVEKITAFVNDQDKMNGLIKKAKIFLAGLIGVVVSLTAAQIALNIAMIANPIGLIIVGIAAAVAAITMAITAIALNWDSIVEWTRMAVEKIKSFFTDTTFGKILMLPFLPIITAIKLIMKGISAIKRWRSKGKGEDDIALAELQREINIAAVERISAADIKASQTLDVNLKIDSEGRPSVAEVSSDGGLNFSADTQTVPAF